MQDLRNLVLLSIWWRIKECRAQKGAFFRGRYTAPTHLPPGPQRPALPQSIRSQTTPVLPRFHGKPPNPTQRWTTRTRVPPARSSGSAACFIVPSTNLFHFFPRPISTWTLVAKTQNATINVSTAKPYKENPAPQLGLQRYHGVFD